MTTTSPEPVFTCQPEGALSLRVTRRFAAAPEAVIRAHLEPATLRGWIGSASMPLEICEVDARPGGRLRYLWRMPDKSTMGLTGQFESLSHSRVVHSELFEPDWTGGEARVITDFLPEGDGTLLRMEVIYATPEARDHAAASGMAAGMAEAYDRLAALL